MMGFYAAGAMGQHGGGGGGGGFPNPIGSPLSGLFSDLTSHAVPMPVSVNAGDLLIIQFTCGSTNITTPSGWTLLGTQTNTGIRLTFFTKIAVGTEGGTTVSVGTMSSQNSTYIVRRIEAGTFDPISAVEIAFSTGAAATDPDPPSLSPTGGADDYLWIAAYGQRNNLNSPSPSFPFPNGSAYVSTSSSGAAQNNSGSCWTKSNGASINPGLFTGVTASSNSTWVGATISVPPAP